jgi:hypothetical protein
MARIKINGETFKAPKKRITNPLMLDEKYTGEEPIFHGVEFKDESSRRVAMMRAFNYYNYFNSGKHFKKDVIKYAKDELNFSKDKLELLASSPDWACELQSGALLRMRSRGLLLRDNEYAFINTNLQKMEHCALKKVKDDAEELLKNPDKVVTPVISVQDRIRFKVNETILEDLDYKLDEWIKGDSPEIDVYEAMKSHLLPAQASKYVIEWAEKYKAELQEAIDKTCPQIIEAYSHLSASRKKQFMKWYEGIIADAKRFGTNTKVVRKVRAKKPVSIDKQLAKLKYMKECTENKLVSVNPAIIIGATELWTYNVKYKALTRYVAESGMGFEIKGTTLIKYDEAKSETRKLRKPEVTLAEVLSTAKTKGLKAFAALTTKPSVPNGRLNEDTIILKASK